MKFTKLLFKTLALVFFTFILGINNTEAQTWTAPTLPGSDPVSGTTYYMYNVGSNGYLNRGGWWRMMSVVTASPKANASSTIIKWTAVNTTGSTWTFQYNSNGLDVNNNYLFAASNDGSIYTDNSSDNTWNVVETDASNNIYSIQVVSTYTAGYNSAQFLGTAPTPENTNFGYAHTVRYNTNAGNSYTQWKFVSQADLDLYNAKVLLDRYMTYAKLKGGITLDSYITTYDLNVTADINTDAASLLGVLGRTDVSASILNNSFETGDLTDWTNNGFVTQSNDPNQNWTKDGTYYAEKYTWSGNNAGEDHELSAATITQTLSGLSNGLYELVFSGHAIQQAGSNPLHTGAFVKCGSSSTEVSSGGDYIVSNVTVTTGSLTIGYELEGTIACNWTGFDNFKLYYYGESPATLSAISLSIGNLVPDFEPGKTAYVVGVPLGTLSVDVDATTTNVNDNITSGTGTINLTAGYGSTEILVTAQDGITQKTYTVEFKEENYVQTYATKTNLVGDPTVSNLSNFGGWGTKSINTDIDYTYCGITSGKVGSGSGSLDVNSITFNPDTTYRLLAKVYVESGVFRIGISDGSTNVHESLTTKTGEWETIDTVFTTTAGATTTGNMWFNNSGLTGSIGYIDNWELYEVDNDVTLKTLTTDIGTLNPVFDPLETTYGLQVSGNPASVTLTAEANSLNSVVTGDGVITLTGAVTVANIQVTAESGTIQTYTINISSLSGDATLSDLTVGGLTINGFNTNTTTYYYALADGATVVPSVAGTANDVNATSVVVTDASSVGGKTTVVVTAEDGLTSKTYNVNFVTKVHAYTFDSDVTDGIGSADGTVQGAATVAGGELVLDANGDYLSFVGTELGLDAYSTVTFEYMYHSAQGLNTGWNWTSYFGDNNGANNIRLGLNALDEIKVNYSGSEIKRTEVDDDNYHHLVIVLSDSKLSYYLDGEYQNQTTLSGVTIGTAQSYIGKGSDAWSDPTWQGEIDEFNIYTGSMLVDSISTRGTNYINSKNALLASLSTDVGTLTPVFDAGTTHYAIEVPAGTTTVNLTASPEEAGSGVTGAGVVDMTGGETTATIVVTSVDGNTTKTYTVDILFEDATCYVPLYSNRTNLISDPEITDLGQFSGWGSRGIEYGLNAYCGLSCGYIDGGSLDYVLTGIKKNTTYRIKAMVNAASTDANIGLWGWDAFKGDSVAHPTVAGEWTSIELIVTTGDSLKATQGLFFNNSAGSKIDNWEMYELNNDNTLSDLKVDGATVTGFDAATLSYSIMLPYGSTTIPAVTATANNAFAGVVISAATSLPDTTTVIVTAEDGVSIKTYNVIFVYEANNDATLSDITIDGTTIEGFNTDSLNYTIELPFGTTDAPVIVAETTDPNASAAIDQAVTLTDTTVITVTAEDGTTMLSYNISYSVAAFVSTDASLQSIKVNGIALPEFSANKYMYRVVTPYNAGVPLVTGVKNNLAATMVIDTAESLVDTTVITVTAQDGVTTLVYKVSFAVVYDVTFIVSNESSEFIEGAQVIFMLDTLSTDINGNALFTMVSPTTNVAYLVTKQGYNDVSGTLSVVDTDVIQNITMQLTTYGLTFNVVDEENNAIALAQVVFQNDTINTDANGVALFTEIVPVDSAVYTVSKVGYVSFESYISVVDGDVIENVTLQLQTYQLTFNIADIDQNPIDSAELVFNGDTTFTDTLGRVVITDLLPGQNLKYSISKSKYVSVSDSITIAAKNDTVNVVMQIKTYNVKFAVADSESNVVADAKVEFNSEILFTDVNGIVNFTHVNATINAAYTVSKEGYQVATGTVTVTDVDVDVDVTLIVIPSPIVLVSSITVTGTDLVTTITTKGGTLQVSATVLPLDATNKEVDWTVTNVTGEATISETGLVTAVKDGTVSVKATATDGSAVSDSIVITISNQGTSISTNELSGLSIYPNPVNEEITISANTSFKSIEIFNVDGTLINRLDNAASTSRINVSELTSGVYIIRLTTANDCATKRFVKK